MLNASQNSMHPLLGTTCNTVLKVLIYWFGFHHFLLCSLRVGIISHTCLQFQCVGVVNWLLKGWRKERREEKNLHMKEIQVVLMPYVSMWLYFRMPELLNLYQMKAAFLVLRLRDLIAILPWAGVWKLLTYLHFFHIKRKST